MTRHIFNVYFVDFMLTTYELTRSIFYIFQVVSNKTQNSPKAKPKTIQPTTTSTTSSEAVQLRRGQQSRTSANNKKKCRVLFSYQPKHDDELKLGKFRFLF